MTAPLGDTKKARERMRKAPVWFTRLTARVHVPGLDERREDIPLLAHFFLRKYNERLGKQIDGLDEEVLAIFQTYRWTGNVRELENVMERAVILELNNSISARSLPPNLTGCDYARNASVSHFMDLEFRRAKTLAVPACRPLRRRTF